LFVSSKLQINHAHRVLHYAVFIGSYVTKMSNISRITIAGRRDTRLDILWRQAAAVADSMSGRPFCRSVRLMTAARVRLSAQSVDFVVFIGSAWRQP